MRVGERERKESRRAARLVANAAKHARKRRCSARHHAVAGQMIDDTLIRLRADSSAADRAGTLSPKSKKG
jgi:hypothetical protein